MDLPIQCPNTEPTNTVLGLQELGETHKTIQIDRKKRIENCFLDWFVAGLKLERRIEEAVPAGQQLQELGMKYRCDDSGSENVSFFFFFLFGAFSGRF